MADDDAEVVYDVVEYTDGPDGEPEVTNWIKRAGNVNITYVNGCTFSGTYDENKLKQGNGVYVWKKKSEEEDDGELKEVARYEGNYVDGMRSGFGTFTFPNGDIYEGEFSNNRMEGTGTYTYKHSQDIYSGSWVADKKHGQGTYEYAADKSLLIGTWEKGNIVSGDWVLKDAATYSGSFKRGVPVGAGKFTFKSGLVLPGVFEEATSAVEVSEAQEEQEPAEEGAEAAAPVEEEPTEPPVVTWKGERIVSF